MNDWYNDDASEDTGVKSKTQVKKEMHALQDLGKELTHLNKEQLAAMPLPDDLRLAIEQAQGMKKREALRRQLQYIGKLMRKTETEEIEAAYNDLQERHNRSARALHLVEQWRDELIAGDESVITKFIDEYPDVDRQQLRNLVRGAKQELSQQKPPAHKRKLFKLIRDTMEG